MKNSGLLDLLPVLTVVALFLAGCGGKKTPEYQHQDISRLLKNNERVDLSEYLLVQADTYTATAYDTILTQDMFRNWNSPKQIVITAIMFIRTDCRNLIQRMPEFFMDSKAIEPFFDKIKQPFIEASFSIINESPLNSNESTVSISVSPPICSPAPYKLKFKNRLAYGSEETFHIHLRKALSTDNKKVWSINPSSLIDLAIAMGIDAENTYLNYSLSDKIIKLREYIVADNFNDLEDLFTEEKWKDIQQNPLFLKTLKSNMSESYLSINYNSGKRKDLVFDQPIDLKYIKEGEVFKEEVIKFKWTADNGWRIYE